MNGRRISERILKNKRDWKKIQISIGIFKKALFYECLGSINYEVSSDGYKVNILNLQNTLNYIEIKSIPKIKYT